MYIVEKLRMIKERLIREENDKKKAD